MSRDAPRDSPFRHRGFRWLWTGSLFSYASHWIQQASMGWVVYEITGSAVLLGAVLGVRALPMLVLSPLSGVAADRYNRRGLLQASQVFAAAVALVFGAALALHAVGIGALFAFSLLMGAAATLDRPARHSMAFELVPRSLAAKAVALNIIGNNLARVLAPALAGYLIAWLGVAGNFIIQGGCYLVAAAMVLLVAVPPRGAPPRDGSALRELAEGLRYAAADRSMRLLFALGAMEFFVLVPTLGTLFPIYAKDVFDVGPQGLGLMYTAMGIGGVAGGYAATVLARYSRTGLVQTVCIVGCSLAILAIGLSPGFAFAFGAIMVAGAFEMLLASANLSALQMLAPEAMRGRITSLLQIYPATIALGSFLIGPLADLAGARGASILAATACLAGTLALWSRSPRLRALRVR